MLQSYAEVSLGPGRAPTRWRQFGVCRGQDLLRPNRALKTRHIRRVEWFWQTKPGFQPGISAKETFKKKKKKQKIKTKNHCRAGMPG